MAPTRRVVFMATCWPKTWKSGSAPMITSSCSKRLESKALLSTLNMRFRCVRRAPFGRPVVPLVKKMTATSPGSRTA